MNASEGETSNIVMERTLFYGRTLSEYQQIFDLDFMEWKGRTVLDVPSGASSFAAEAGRMGVRAVACDPQYGRDIRELSDLAKVDIERSLESLRQKAQGYNWTFYPSILAVKQYRLAALERFSRDYPAGVIEGRYIKAALPLLPFDDQAFDLVLSGYFLFFNDQFDYGFLMADILELYRVCRLEVRIFPIRSAEAEDYSQWGRLMDDLAQRDIQTEITPISFEFQRGNNKLLRLIRR